MSGLALGCVLCAGVLTRQVDGVRVCMRHQTHMCICCIHTYLCTVCTSTLFPKILLLQVKPFNHALQMRKQPNRIQLAIRVDGMMSCLPTSKLATMTGYCSLLCLFSSTWCTPHKQGPFHSHKVDTVCRILHYSQPQRGTSVPR